MLLTLSLIHISPILAVLTGQGGTLDVAPHRYHDVDRQNIVKQLTALGSLHINVIKLLHKAHGIGVYLWLGFCAGRIADEHV